jgi:hypothetical protein
MHRLLLILLLCVSISSYAQDLPHHQLQVTLHPAQQTIEVRDHIALPDDVSRTLVFWLHKNLNPKLEAGEMVATSAMTDRLQQYRVILVEGQNSLTLRYGGKIYHPQKQDVREARTFESSPGIISDEGVMLSGSSGWYPLFAGELGDKLLTFSLSTSLPQDWQVVSQGVRTIVHGQIRWHENQSQDEIYLIAAAFKRYAQKINDVEAEVYFRQPEAKLAQRYLTATKRYLTRYQRLFGPYPYAKFALVENFWESGYGMPSFTLMGSQVVRLPFIIHTSFPHEILHNWWGNGVYVDYQGGNWSEGLTAYLADHLLQENRGTAAVYRRGLLQKYSDYVTLERDFPLSKFTSRHSAQSEAVGYGKAMMMFHMLRRQIGDEIFVQGLRDFYANNRFRRANFADLEQAFSQVAKIDFSPFFEQWVQRSGAPQLHLVSVQSVPVAGGYDLTVILEQTQLGEAYQLNIPLAVTLAGESAVVTKVVGMRDKRAKITLRFESQPLRVDVDAEFDVFRRLDRSETPAAFSQVFGAEELLVVLPRMASEQLRIQYLKVAKSWKRQPERETLIKWDDEVESLPTSGAVWLFGRENRWHAEFQQVLQQSGASLSEKYGNQNTAAAVSTHIDGLPVACLSAPNVEMLAGLARKLPHYAKYSHVLFAGEKLRNIDKGRWPVKASSMTMMVQQANGQERNVKRGDLPSRNSLAR